MLHEQTLQQLRTLRLDGMAAALQDPAGQIAAAELPFEQRLGTHQERHTDSDARVREVSGEKTPGPLIQKQAAPKKSENQAVVVLLATQQVQIP